MGLSLRLALLLTGLVLLTAATSAGLIYARLNVQLVAAKERELERETELQAAGFVGAIDELLRDVTVLAGTPPIQGIIRTRAAGGIDPTDGSTEALWRARLTTIFTQVLASKPQYLQARLLGPAGHELVRVDRKDGAVVGTAVADLQDKHAASYFRAALRHPAGRPFLSPINLNREHGRIQLPHVPVVRAVMPVHGRDGRGFFGIVVINYSVHAALQRLRAVPTPSHQYYVTNANGSYLLHPDPQRAFAFDLTGIRGEAFEDFALLRQLHRGHAEALSQTDHELDRVVSVRRVSFGGAERARSIDVVVVDGLDDVTGVAREVFRQALLVIGALLLVALGLGVLMSRVMVQPIERLARAVRGAADTGQAPEIPSGLSAEAGELASALDAAFTSVELRNQALQAKNRELEQFIYIASHDLQEPLRTITSFSDYLQSRHRERLDGDALRALDFMTDSSERMQALVLALLEYGRLGRTADPEQVDLVEILDEVRRDLGSLLAQTGAELEVSALPTLKGYRLELRMLFQNLLSNALKYRKPNVTPHVAITAERMQGEQAYQVCFTDNGIGIPPQHRERVFLIFQRLHGRESYDGTGIGLAHCRKIVELHGGRIWIEDGQDGGIRVAFTLHDELVTESDVRGDL